MNSWWEIFAVFILSTVKFVFGGVPLALTYNFSFFESVTITSLGGFTGAIFFVYISEKLIVNYKKRIEKKLIPIEKKNKKKIFTRRRRFIIRVKQQFGLTGIAALTPLILSIPFGCFIAVRYFKDKQMVLIYIFTSILSWSIVSYYLYKPLIYAIRTYLL
ncbi:MAG: hypothetical protein WCP52_02950 [Bacteroidota bacterium]